MSECEEKKLSPQLFDEISPTYDRINRVLSCGLDLYWRRQVGHYLPSKERLELLDCATGTGDQLLALIKNHSRITSATGVDLAKEMLEIAKKKSNRAEWVVGDLLKLPFAANTFDVATISFGIRNVPDPLLGLKEMHRILRPQGRAIILEFSLPRFALLRGMHLFYLRHLLPRIGGWISGNKEAYRYLNRTIENFPYGQAFCALMQEAGFVKATAHPLTGGIVTLYIGER